MQENNAACIEQIFKQFHKLDKGLTANIKNPELKKAYAQFTKNMFRAGEQAAANTKKTGKVNNVKLDADHKKINDAFFLLQSNELDNACNTSVFLTTNKTIFAN